MDFIHNAWYVAGWFSEFTNELQRVTILEQNIVMYRSSNGAVVALEDRCPHRLLPLSKGKRIGDTIQCGYHGMTFDCKGNCVRIPGQKHVPESITVKTYPVHNKHDIIWIWMGDAKLANIDDIFDMTEFDDPAWHAHQGDALHLKSNYLNVAENLVDPAHVSFVHPTTLGNVASESVPVHVSTDGRAITAWRWIRNSEPIGFFQNFGNFTGKVDRWHYYYLYTPCTAVIDFGSAATEANLTEEERSEGVRIFALHFMTPVNSQYTIDRWMHIRNTAIDDDSASIKMDEMFRIAFAEDKEILEAIQAEENIPSLNRPVRIAIDKGPLAYRKRIDNLINEEKPSTV